MTSAKPDPATTSNPQSSEGLDQRVAERTADLSRALEALAQAKAEVEEQRHRFQQILECLPLGVLVMGHDGANVFTNQRVVPLSNRDVPDHFDLRDIRTDYAMVVAGTDLPYPIDRMPGFRALAGEESYVEDMEMEGADGRIRVAVRATPMHDAGGAVVAAIITVEDISERTQRAAELANEKELLAVTLRAITDGVVAIDGEGRVAMMNPAAEKITGCAAKAALGHPAHEVFALAVSEEGHTSGVPVPLAEVLTGRLPMGARGEGRLLSPCIGDAERIVAYSLAPVRDVSSAVRGAALCFRDVTAQRAAEREHLRASKLDSIGILAGGIAHDFNNILTSLLAAASLAEAEAGDPAALAEYLSEIRAAALRARDLTQQLLTFSRGGQPVRETAALGALVRESVVFALHGSRVRGELDIPDDLYAVELDRGQLGQVINNLTINAVQAMPEGGVLRVSARNGSDEALGQGPSVTVTFADQGVGIAPEHLGKIFDPYFTTKQRGSGLGLATSYSIVKNHGGVLTVRSTLGKGTTFSLVLPASEQAAPAKPRVEALVRGSGRVLVMDDEEPIRRVAVRMFERLGFEALAAPDGAEALAMLRAAEAEGRPFTLVVVDLTVPGGMGGVAMAAELRAAGTAATLVASSGYSTDPIMARFSEYGFDGVLKKPYTMPELSACLGQLAGLTGVGKGRPDSVP